MARKDEIFMSFINHELINEKYELSKTDLPHNLKDGLKSEHTIIKAIALVVENTEGLNPLSDKALYGQITQFLNEATI
jgi:hypothetical protein